MRVVRTESLRAANFGIEQSALRVYAGRQLKKQWVTFFDNKTRDWHADAHNQTVDFEKSFEVGGELMQRPERDLQEMLLIVDAVWYPFQQM